MKRKAPADPVQAARKAAQRAALNALKRARRRAEKAGVVLSEWEDGFLGSVAERVETYGRAFGDPEKGAPGQALSALQARKLKEIVAKAKEGEGADGAMSGTRDEDAAKRPAASRFGRKPRRG